MKKIGVLLVLFFAITGVAASATPPVQTAFIKYAKENIATIGGKSHFIGATCQAKAVVKRVYVCQLRATSIVGKPFCDNVYVAYVKGYQVLLWPTTWVCGKKPAPTPPPPPLSVFVPNSITGPGA